jgi:RluA family pseudouridine synthase
MSAEEVQFTVPEHEDGERLDRLVASHVGCSRRVARVLIGQGSVRVRGRVLKILSRAVRAGAHVSVQQRPESGRPDAPDVEILHLDRWVVAVAKPAGLLSETDRQGSPSVETAVVRLLADRGERRTEVKLVHRLDAGTSGVLLLARTPMAARELGAVFARARARKEYLALVAGRLATPRNVREPIRRAAGVRHEVGEGGKQASTRFEPLRVGKKATLVRALPRTGRTHQIRVHLAHLGHPIVGDRLYGGPGYTDSQPPEPIPRPMLHAARLEVPHPKTGDPLVLAIEPPADFVTQAHRLGIWSAEAPVSR